MKSEEILIRITDAQFVAFKRLPARHKDLPTDLYFDGYSALMCNPRGVIIGIEHDGYAHS